MIVFIACLIMFVCVPMVYGLYQNCKIRDRVIRKLIIENSKLKYDLSIYQTMVGESKPISKN